MNDTSSKVPKSDFKNHRKIIRIFIKLKISLGFFLPPLLKYSILKNTLFSTNVPNFCWCGIASIHKTNFPLGKKIKKKLHNRTDVKNAKQRYYSTSNSIRCLDCSSFGPFYACIKVRTFMGPLGPQSSI